MSLGDNSPGMSKFVGALDMLACKRTNNSLVLDYGVIQGDGSLLTNTFPVPIPKKDYMCCRHLGSWEITKNTKTTSVGDHGSHSHSFTIERRERLKTGDRVLVAWIQNDAVVVDVIAHAADIL